MASPVDTSVKFIHSDMPGAPALTGTAGSLISLLDAFLVTGFGLKAVDSAAIADGKCRLTFASGASCADNNAVILVSGATPAGLNGEQKVTAFSPTWVEFATALPDGAVTGTVQFKMAPLGWEKVFTGTNKAVYRSRDPAGTRPYLRVIDGWDGHADWSNGSRVNMFESMTDVDTGFGQATTVAGGEGLYWWKTVRGNADVGPYKMVGDSRMFYFCPKLQNIAAMHYAFGDPIPYRSGDAYCGLITGNAGNQNYSYGNIFFRYSSSSMLTQRASHGLGGAMDTDWAAPWAGGSSKSGYNDVIGYAPARATNSLLLSDIYVFDGGAGNGIRSRLPGALWMLQGGGDGLFPNDHAQIQAPAALGDRKLLVSRNAGDYRPGYATDYVGVGFFDITGPWR